MQTYIGCFRRMYEPIRDSLILVVAVVPMAMKNLWVVDKSEGNSESLNRTQKVKSLKGFGKRICFLSHGTDGTVGTLIATYKWLLVF